MSEIQYKRCSKCKQEFPATTEYFQRHSKTKDGLVERCKNCTNKHPIDLIPQGMKRCNKCKRIFEATTENFRLRVHRNKLLGVCRSCEHERDAQARATNKARFQETQERYRVNNPEKLKASKKKWNDNNKPYSAKKHAEKYINNRDKIRKRQKEYDLNFPEKKRARSQKRRAKMRNADGFHTELDIAMLYEEQEERCAYCGMTIYWDIEHDIHIDHIQPISRGGSNWPDNIACVCASCNLNKGNKTITEWMAVRGW